MGFDINEMSGFDADAIMNAFVSRDPLFLQAACDLRVGCPATRFKVTAVGYGGANATWTLPRIVGPAKAKELLMTGRTVDAEEAPQIGLLNACANEHRAIADAFRAEFAWVVDSLRASRQSGADVFTGFLDDKRQAACRRRHDVTDLSADYVIVDAGSAGCVLANRLSEDGRSSVLLIEAGGESTSFMVQMPVGFARMLVKDKYDWQYQQLPDPSTNGRRAIWSAVRPPS